MTQRVKVLVVKPAFDPAWKEESTTFHQPVLTSPHKPEQLNIQPTHKEINVIEMNSSNSKSICYHSSNHLTLLEGLTGRVEKDTYTTGKELSILYMRWINGLSRDGQPYLPFCRTKTEN